MLFLHVFNTPFCTFSYFTYFYFLVLYLYVANFIFTFKRDNDRSSVETSLIFPDNFYLNLWENSKTQFGQIVILLSSMFEK